MKRIFQILGICLLMLLVVESSWLYGQVGGPEGGGVNLGTPGATTPAKYHISGGVSVSGDWNINGPVVIVTDGNFNVGNNTVTINLGGSLTVYVRGDINVVGNGGFNNSNRPETLQIFGTNPHSQSFTISGNGFLSAVVYAPNASITSNGGGSNGAMLGSVIGNKITFHGSPGPFHFDEALRDLDVVDSLHEITEYRIADGPASPMENYAGAITYREFFDRYFPPSN